MNIEKSNLAKFSQRKFIEPDSFYWPGYMWLWNDRLSKESLFEQLRQMNEAGARTVWVVPLTRNFRPDSMPTYLEPEYLTEEYLELYKEFVKEIHRLNMVHWLSDEPGWPSGSVCGQIVSENPSLGYKWIERNVIEPECGECVQVPVDCLSAYLFHNKTKIKRINPGEKEEITGDDIIIEIYFQRSVCGIQNKSTAQNKSSLYPDLLNPKSAQEFIRMTHEVYKKAIGEYFGDTVTAFFNDESKVVIPPWTDALAEDFRREKGYDLLDHLPAIFNDDNVDENMKVRIGFFDWWTNRLAEAYFEQIENWCRNNKILSIGHMLGEHTTLGARKWGTGHVLRVLRRFDIPGVDTVWRQLYPYSERSVEVTIENKLRKYPDNQPDTNHHFPKYASSVAHQAGKPWALTESFAIYGSGLNLEQMKWLTDYQYVRGLNIMTMSCCYSTPKGQFMGGCRPMFIPANPQWNYFYLYNSYTARLSYVLSLGSPVIETAVYFPARDIWAGGPEIDEIAASNDTLARLLLEHQCDFDFIDDDLLESDTTEIKDGKLTIGPMKYTVICVSRSRWMSEKSRERLSCFASQGGKVLWMDNRKYSNCPGHCTETDFIELKNHINLLIRVQPHNDNIRVCSRKLENGQLYFITNEDAREFNGTIGFDETLPLFVFDPQTGGCWNPKEAAYLDEGCFLPIHLPFAGSMLVFFTCEHIAEIPEPINAADILLTINGGWMCRKLKSYRIGEQEFEIETELNEEHVLIELGDWRYKFGDEFSGHMEYGVEFECSRNEAETACMLDLGAVKYNCEVILNDINLGKKSWQPFSYQIKGMVKEGLNDLRVIVSNTMANQYVTTKSFDKYPENVIGVYHNIEIAFEKQALESGLYGPVTLLGIKE